MVWPIPDDVLVANVQALIRIKNTQESLRQIEEKYRTLVEQLPAITYIAEFGGSGAWTYVSPQIHSLLGFTPEEWVADQRMWFRQLHPDDRERVLAQEQMSKGTGSFYSEYRLNSKDGRAVWFRDEARVIRDERTKKQMMQGVMLDITERKQAEEAKRESEERFRQMAETIDEVFWVTSADKKKVLYVSPAYEKISGRSAENLVKGADLYLDLLHPDDKERIIKLFMESGDGTFEEEYRIVRPDGVVRWLWTRAFPVRNQSNEIFRMVGVSQDITNRKQAEEALKRSEGYFRSLVENALDIIQILNNECSVLFTSPSVERILGYTPEELFGKAVFEHAHPEDLPAISQVLQWVLRNPGSTESMIYRIQHKDGDWRFVESICSIHTGSTEVGIVVNTRDITERKQVEEELDQSLSLLRATLESTADGILVVDSDGKIVSFNSKFLEMWHIPVPVIASREDDQALAFVMAQLKDPEGFVEKVKELYANNEDESYDILDFHDGRVFERFSKPQRVGEKIVGRVWSFRDITEQRRAEDELIKQQQFLRQVMDINPNLIFAKDWNGRFTMANQAVADIYGTTIDELIGKTDADFNGNINEIEQFLWDDREVMMTLREKFIAVEPVTDSNGRTRWFQTKKVPLKATDGGAYQVLGVASDVTERLGAEKLQSALFRIAEKTTTAENFQEFYSSLHSIIGELMYARNFYIALHNTTTDRLEFPYFVDEIDSPPDPQRIGKGLTEYVLRTGQPLLATPEKFEELVSTGDVQSVGCASVDWLGVPLKSGETSYGVIAVQSYTESLRFGEKEKEVLTFVSQHIATALERKRAQESLRESEGRYRLMADNATDMISRHTPDGTYLYVSPASAALLGYHPEELIGKSIYEFFHFQDIENLRIAFQGIMENPVSDTVSYRIKRRDGNYMWLETTARCIGNPETSEREIIAVSRDITERKQAEEVKEKLEDQLRQSQKMEAIGLLAGGVAHDFNNILMAITGYCELLLMKMSPADTLCHDILEIRKASEQGAGLTRQLLAFSRKQVLAPKVLDMNQVIKKMNNMVQRLIGENIELIHVFEEDLGRVKVDPAQMEQVVMNLAVNARDAMPMGGKLIVETSNMEFKEPQGSGSVQIPADRYVTLSVSDNGTGMDEGTRSRIFEPFFTTKGKGSGLGLSTVYGIVSQSGGYIDVESQPGKGTAFRIYFPRVDDFEPETEVRSPAAKMSSGSETVLLVDDNELVRNVLKVILQTAGYRVLDASSGTEALKVSREYREPLHLIITDVVMPQMSGPELWRSVVSERPNTKVLFISGYSEEAVVSQGVLDVGTTLLSKPVSADALLRKMREILD
jgi:PAS domain S-box-containing protein